MSGGRKGRPPAWLTRLHAARPSLHPVECAGCGRWVIEDRDKVEWTRWDAGVLTGEDVTVAVILGRRLMRLRRVGLAVGLSLTFGELGLDPGGEYLAEHDCGHAPICTRPFEEHAPAARGDLSWLPETRSPPGSDDPWAGVPIGLF